MEKVYCFLLAASLTNISCLLLAGNIQSISAKTFSKNPQNYFQENLQALGNETKQQAPETLKTPAQQQQQQLEQKEEKLERELEIEPENPEDFKGEEVPGPEEQLEPEGIDDNFPAQPPDEEIQINR